jgi:PilZ domain
MLTSIQTEAFGPQRDTMAQENDEGIAYLTALKKSDGAPTTNATAAAHEGRLERNARSASAPGRPGSQPQFNGVEKRRSSRFHCEGSVEMREEGCDVRTWATFTDISLHGCYVEAQATYPAGTILHMKMEANGIQIETKGNVRVAYPYMGMGIAFSETTEENLKRIKLLLGLVALPPAITGPGLVSPLPSTAPQHGIPEISDAASALHLLTKFFEARHMLTREDFVEILRKSQGATKLTTYEGRR